jgi:hypothetical protein
MWNVMKIFPIGFALFRADRQTDMTSVIVAFRNCFFEGARQLCLLLCLCLQVAWRFDAIDGRRTYVVLYWASMHYAVQCVIQLSQTSISNPLHLPTIICDIYFNRCYGCLKTQPTYIDIKSIVF